MKKQELIDLSGLSNKKLILLFSAGYDSTALLLNLIISGCRQIECIYVKIPNNKDKSVIEIKRCKKILKAIKKKYSINIPFTILTSQSIPDGDTTSYCQPFLFISTICPVLKEDIDYVLFGYIRTDDIWHCWQSFEDTFKSINALIRWRRYNNMDGYKNILPYAPYELLYKNEIIKHLVNNHKKIFKLCWTCEDPKNGKPCKKCYPCMKLKQLTMK
jgi:7-cyano-7-deazaguanine synthase in queuosine biosynthesis